MRSSRVCPVATGRPARSASAAARLRARARASRPGPGATGPVDLVMRDPERSRQLAAGRGVPLALGAAQRVRDVQRLERMTEGSERVGEQRRVRPARDEREHRLPGDEQTRTRDGAADPLDQSVVERHPATSRPA